jgi:hypothetical protein
MIDGYSMHGCDLMSESHCVQAVVPLVVLLQAHEEPVGLCLPQSS